MPAGGVIAFRCDASAVVGLGHLMRCHTLADELVRNGWDCHFLMCDPIEAAKTLVDRAGHKLWLLEGGSLERDADILARICPDRLVVDHYGLDAHWTAEVAPFGCAVMVIDDLADRPHVCDLLLDQTLDRRAEDYAGLVPDWATCLLGTSYALLRPQFAELASRLGNRPVSDSPKRVLVSLGGTDPNCLSLDILCLLEGSPLSDKTEVTVIIGQNASCLDQLHAFARSSRLMVRVETGVEDMAQILSQVDLAIGAAGGSAWERCVMGVPTILLVIADNQLGVAHSLIGHGAALAGGDQRENGWKEVFAGSFTKILKPDVRSELRARSQQVCDGLGVSRVAAEIMSRHCTLRTAHEADAAVVWQMRYHKNTADFFRSSDVPTFEQHVAWFKSALASAERTLLIVEQDGEVVAHTRIDRLSEDAAEFSIVVNPKGRGSGLGRQSLRLTIVRAHALGFKTLQAEVHQRNAASVNLFREAGFTPVSQEGDFLKLVKQI